MIRRFMMNKTLSDMIDIVGSHLKSLDIEAYFNEETDSFDVINDKNNNGDDSDIWFTINESCILVSFFIKKFNMNPDKTGNFLMLINKININIDNVQFVYSFDNASIWCRSFINCTGIQPSKEMIYDSYLCVIEAAHKYGAIIIDAVKEVDIPEFLLDNLLKDESKDGIVY